MMMALMSLVESERALMNLQVGCSLVVRLVPLHCIIQRSRT